MNSTIKNNTRKPLIVGTGLSGMVGSRVVELLEGKFDFINFSLETGVDITNSKQLQKVLNNIEPHLVLHMAAKTDVDSCELEKNKGKDSVAWQVNVNGTKNFVEYCLNRKIRMIYISTDYVFSGKKKFYIEDDNPDPGTFYGLTKLEGEKQLEKLGDLALICRISFPYRAQFVPKTDLVRAIMGKLSCGEKVQGIKDQIITPTFIDDICRALDLLMARREPGIFHLVGSETLTPLDLAATIAEKFHLDPKLIQPVSRGDYFANRAPRPYQTNLKNDKIRSLGVNMSTMEEGLEEVKRQLETSGELNL